VDVTCELHTGHSDCFGQGPKNNGGGVRGVGVDTEYKEGVRGAYKTVPMGRENIISLSGRQG